MELLPHRSVFKKSAVNLQRRIQTPNTNIKKEQYTRSAIALSSLAALAFTGSADAALIATLESSASETTSLAAISTMDLLHGLTPNTIGAFTGDSNALNDGASLSNDTNASRGNIYLTSGSLTMTFDLTGSAIGYDLTSIVSITGWVTNAHNHAPQTYQVLVSILGSATYNPTTLTSAAVSGENVSYYPFASGAGSTRVTITNDSGPAIASGVDGIRFIMTNEPSTITNESVYREIDVFGTATIPEPSSPVLDSLQCFAAAVDRIADT